jgi:hypothetical protein
MRLVYHPRYNPVTLGLQRYHPFDLHKFKRVWDFLTLGELHDRNIPTLMLTSGGYSPLSYKIIAQTIARSMYTKPRPPGPS